MGRALTALQAARGVLSTQDWAAAIEPAVAGAMERGALAEQMGRELRALGLEVSGDAAGGWRLEGEADVALPGVLEPMIAGTIFDGGVHHFAQIGSTNVAAMRAGAAGAPHGSVWLAEEQTAGKGRAGHVWKSNPRDGIYCSVLLRPKLAPTDAILFSLVAGLAVVEAVAEVTGLQGDLRWPNDVLLGPRKFCGILTELNAEVTRVRYVVVGMGLNVNHAGFPAELEGIATSLAIEAGQKFSRVALVAALLRNLDREQAALSDGAGVSAARAQILRRFEEHSSYCRGAAVMVEEDGGYEGVTCGLDDRGFLRVESTQGVRTVLSGGVRKR